MRIGLAVVLAVVLAVGAGCAGDDEAATTAVETATVQTDEGGDTGTVETQAESDLATEANRIQAELEQLLRDVSAAGSADEVGDAMEESAERLREAADDLDAVDADPEVEDARDETADAARRLADQLEDAAPAARDGDLREALRAVRELEAVEEVRRGLAELRRRGVAVDDVAASDLEQAAGDARDEVDRAFEDLARARSSADVADRMEEAAARLRAAADEVEAADADGGAVPAQQRFAASLRELADELDRAAPDVRDGNVAQALQRAQALEAVDEVEDALRELREQGVDVPDLDSAP